MEKKLICDNCGTDEYVKDQYPYPRDLCEDCEMQEAELANEALISKFFGG
jgi:hypothetical protein